MFLGFFSSCIQNAFSMMRLIKPSRCRSRSVSPHVSTACGIQSVWSPTIMCIRALFMTDAMEPPRLCRLVKSSLRGSRPGGETSEPKTAPASRRSLWNFGGGQTECGSDTDSRPGSPECIFTSRPLCCSAAVLQCPRSVRGENASERHFVSQVKQQIWVMISVFICINVRLNWVCEEFF